MIVQEKVNPDITLDKLKGLISKTAGEYVDFNKVYSFTDNDVLNYSEEYCEASYLLSVMYLTSSRYVTKYIDSKRKSLYWTYRHDFKVKELRVRSLNSLVADMVNDINNYVFNPNSSFETFVNDELIRVS